MPDTYSKTIETALSFVLKQKASGANFCDNDGNWNVPYSNWNDDKFNRNANWLENEWNSNNRVVLLVTLFCFHPERDFSQGGFV